MMRARTRKLVGTILLLTFLTLYALGVIAIGAGRITDGPAWTQFAYFLVAGLLWVLPAGLVIAWMQRSE
ncbi:MAG: DUF2842 domain-containing protein [Methyloceanibacter sp.]